MEENEEDKKLRILGDISPALRIEWAWQAAHDRLARSAETKDSASFLALLSQSLQDFQLPREVQETVIRTVTVLLQEHPDKLMSIASFQSISHHSGHEIQIDQLSVQSLLAQERPHFTVWTEAGPSHITDHEYRAEYTHCPKTKGPLVWANAAANTCFVWKRRYRLVKITGQKKGLLYILLRNPNVMVKNTELEEKQFLHWVQVLSQLQKTELNILKPFLYKAPAEGLTLQTCSNDHRRTNLTFAFVEPYNTLGRHI